ncbi:MAG: biotin--[acetyl-CoA-carboxylase] ligase [Myxococcota bacterium]|nr:biotin--[acetyl-CoA-carboxylase] ligase [Myxococcota bacterium]
MSDADPPRGDAPEGSERVLALLREAEGTLSGERLSEALGVSRAQIWKHVEALRSRGYEIRGAAGGGYALEGAPDRIYPAEVQRGLETLWLARDLRWLDSTDSTNRVADELAREGAAHGTTVVAEGQTAGRGRLGRSFFSPPYTNLYTSVVLRPEISLQDAPTTILAAGIAVAETCRGACEAAGIDPDGVEIKWPNDVLLGGRKTSGILMELAAEATRVAHLVLGIGVNLNVDAATFPDEFRARATSLRAFLGAPVDRVGFARSLYGTLEDVLDDHAQGGFAAIRPRFEALFRMGGSPVRVADLAGDTVEGTALGVADDGALRLQPPDPAEEEIRVLAGDVTVLKGSEARP